MEVIVSNPSANGLALATSNWVELVPEIIKRLNFSLVLETPQSAAQLHTKYGSVATEFIGSQFEEVIWQSFIEEDYGTNMHMLTMRDASRRNSVCGFVFWRDIEKSEMKHWMNVADKSELQKALQHVQQCEDQESTRLALTRHNSQIIDVDSVFCDWVQIELIVTHRDYLGRRVGTMLLASALVYAAKHRKKHSVLHVAGGFANHTAIKLYERFGFEEQPKELFNKPNANLYILWDILSTLHSFDWRVLLQGHGSNDNKNNNNEIEPPRKATQSLTASSGNNALEWITEDISKIQL